MARRSRKRRRRRTSSRSGAEASGSERGGEPARAQAAGGAVRPPRAGSARIEDRPPPLWGGFPLTELITLAGIGLMAWGFLSGPGREGNLRMAAGLAIASVAGLELAIREHVTGFRSHTTLLSGAVGIAVIVALGLGAGLETLGVLVVAGALAFAASFVALRELFRRRSGGLSFR